MKKLLLLIIVSIVIFTSCEHKSGHLDKQPKIEKYVSNDSIVVIIKLYQTTVIDSVGLKMFKYSIEYNTNGNNVKGHVLLNNHFDYNDKIIIKKNRILEP